MPVYQYECKSCGGLYEILQTVKPYLDEIICERCGKKAKKIISLSSFVINGYSSKNSYSKEQR
jgi:putative FmdB family regulatory protein